jgi:hypothetical protein
LHWSEKEEMAAPYIPLKETLHLNTADLRISEDEATQRHLDWTQGLTNAAAVDRKIRYGLNTMGIHLSLLP